MTTSPDTGSTRQPTGDPEGTTVDLLDPGILADPFSAYARIREESPVVRADFFGGEKPIWLVTRSDEAKTVLSDPRFVNNPGNVPGADVANIRDQAIAARGIRRENAEHILESVLDLDAPDHTRLRKLVSRTFTVRRVNELRPRVMQIAEKLLDALPDHADDNGVVDLIENFAYPLPITVICELVGVPEEDRPRWRQWGHALVGSDPDRLNEALANMVEGTRDLIARRRADPGDDLLSGLIRTHDEDGDRLSDSEMITMVITLVLAGHETTAHLIGNGTVALLTHPDQLALLRRDPELLPRAVHELMRWCGPVQGTRARYATEDVEIAGTTIRKGDAVAAILVGANYDPRVYGEPERLDITREPAGRRESHIGFGHGPHYCLGAALARQEGEVAFGTLFDRYPDLALAVRPEELVRQPLPMSWRLDGLPVRLG